MFRRFMPFRIPRKRAPEGADILGSADRSRTACRDRKEIHDPSGRSRRVHKLRTDLPIR
jgi:hypothetical protein